MIGGRAPLATGQEGVLDTMGGTEEVYLHPETQSCFNLCLHN